MYYFPLDFSPRTSTFGMQLHLCVKKLHLSRTNLCILHVYLTFCYLFQMMRSNVAIQMTSWMYCCTPTVYMSLPLEATHASFYVLDVSIILDFDPVIFGHHTLDFMLHTRSAAESDFCEENSDTLLLSEDYLTLSSLRCWISSRTNTLRIWEWARWMSCEYVQRKWWRPVTFPIFIA